MHDISMHQSEVACETESDGVYLFRLSWGGAVASNLALAFLGPVGRFPSLCAVCFVLGVVSSVGVARYFPHSSTKQMRFLWLWLPALCLRMFFAGLFPAGSDLSRYIVEGAVQWAGINPYLVPPAQSIADAGLVNGLAAVLKTVNHAGMTAIYPPGAMLLFRGLAGIAPSAILFKAAMALFEFSGCLIVSRLLAVQKKHKGLIALCLFHPLLLVYGAGEGHLDAVVLCFWMLSLLFFETNRPGWGYVSLGLAAMIKYPALIALPFFITSRNKRKIWLCAVPFLCALPFVSAGTHIFSSLSTFALYMSFNDSIMSLLRVVFEHKASLVGIGLLLAMLVWIWIFIQDRTVSIFAAMGAFLLVSPSLHPWYLMIMVALLPLVPSLAWTYLSAAMVFTFPTAAIEYRTGAFHELYWIKYFEYIPFYVALFFSQRGGHGRYIAPSHHFSSVKTLTVLIPTRNEAYTIDACLESVWDSLDACELADRAHVIVVDADSADNTVELAKAQGVRVLSSPPGRGKQIACGVAATTDDVIMIVHSDSRLPIDVTGRVMNILQRRTTSPGGACKMHFLPRTRKMRLVEKLNDYRVRLTGISFGDQVQFVRREALHMMGGFPSMYLMEDVECSLRMISLGPLCYPVSTVGVLARTWERSHFSWRFLFIICLFLEYLVRRRIGCVSDDGVEFYERYYGPVTVQPDNAI